MLINVSSSSSLNVKKVKGVIPPPPIFPTVVYSTAPDSPAGVHADTRQRIEQYLAPPAFHRSMKVEQLITLSDQHWFIKHCNC